MVHNANLYMQEAPPLNLVSEPYAASHVQKGFDVIFEEANAVYKEPRYGSFETNYELISNFSVTMDKLFSKKPSLMQCWGFKPLRY